MARPAYWHSKKRNSDASSRTPPREATKRNAAFRLRFVLCLPEFSVDKISLAGDDSNGRLNPLFDCNLTLGRP